MSAWFLDSELSTCLVRKLKRGRRSKKRKPQHPWCKKRCGQESKKCHAEKDVKSKWAAKTSCC